MNEIKTIERDRKGNDYFGLIRCRRSNLYLKDLLTLFNIDDYYIMKRSGKQRIVSIEDVKEFRHAGYTFYRKDLYDLEHIENWLDFINNDLGSLPYLTKPLPPFSPNKIIIK